MECFMFFNDANVSDRIEGKGKNETLFELHKDFVKLNVPRHSRSTIANALTFEPKSIFFRFNRANLSIVKIKTKTSFNLE